MLSIGEASWGPLITEHDKATRRVDGSRLGVLSPTNSRATTRSRFARQPRQRRATLTAGAALLGPEHRAPPDPEPRMYRWGSGGPPEMIGAGLFVFVEDAPW